MMTPKRGTIKRTPQTSSKAKVSSSEGTRTGKRRRSQTPSQNGVVGDLHITHSERRLMKTKDVKQIGENAESSKRSPTGAKSNDRRARGASISEEYQRALFDIGVLKIELQRKNDVIFALQTELATMRAAYEEKCAKLKHEITVNNKQKECDIERMKQQLDELNEKNTKLVKQLEEYAVLEYTQAAAGVQEKKQTNEEMYHCEANVLAIIPLSTSFPSDVNEKTELQGVDTHVTQMKDIGQMASDVDLMADGNQNTGTTALQNSLVRNIKKKNRKEHKLPEYEYPPVLGRQIKPSDSGVVNEGECDSKQEMEDEIIEVNNVALLVIDAYTEMLMYEQQTKAPKSADDEKSYIFSTLCLPTIRDVAEDVRDRLKEGTVESQDLVKELLVVDYCPQQKPDSNDCGVIVCFIMKQLVHHLDVDKSMGGESCRTMRASMVKSFVNDRRRSFVAGN
ncbi:hypothetical protein LOK49_LG07G03075 [Camellia lanceoleosa]|uniref:Uncharacterized protein n=1 Tax=Camellia lanceoleosa TaxID=1840588 RepID=A0ACC0H4P3_9ERIC|nr:hypothetical protein LOK49_LG07G03075 [Camellia lanceoleosa]